MILIDIFDVLSKLFAFIKFIVTYDCDVNSHLFFLYFFGIFAEIRQTFRRSVFSARWLFGKMAFRRSGFRQSVVHRIYFHFFFSTDFSIVNRFSKLLQHILGQIKRNILQTKKLSRIK